MDAINYTYLFLTGFFFFLFFFIISIFGYFFLYIIENKGFKRRKSQKEERIKLNFLERLFISFGIGISVYLSYAYWLDLFKTFNFFTAYLSIVVFDCIFLIFYIYDCRKILKEKINSKSIKIQMINYFSNRNNLICLFSLAFVIIISTIIQLIVINDSLSLIYTDPYKFYQNAFFLIDHGHIDYEFLDYNYPAGHTFLTAGALIVYPDFIFGYYYFKLISLFLLPIYIVLAFTIVRNLFKKNYLIFLSLFLIIISRYFIGRTMLYSSSSIASFLLVIILLVVIKKYPDYILGFLLVGLYFFHNLTAFYFIFVLILFYLFVLIRFAKNREHFLKQAYSICLILGISAILLIPYVLSIYIVYNDNILDFINHFFGRFEEYELSCIFFVSKDSQFGLLNLVYPFEYFKPFVENNLLGVINDLFERSIYLFFIFSLMGLFIYIKPKKSGKDIEILAFFKFFILIIMLFFFIPFFVNELKLFEKFGQRTMQSFNLPLIIMAIYFIEWMVNKAKRITLVLCYQFEFYRKLIMRNKWYSKFFKIETIIVTLLLISASSTYYTNRWPDYHYENDDELAEVVLYLREKAEENSKILRQDFDSEVIFRMLYDMEVKSWDLNETSTYNDLLSEITQREIDYLIFPKDYFKDETIEVSLDQNPDFNEKLENDDFILYKI